MPRAGNIIESVDSISRDERGAPCPVWNGFLEI